VILRTDANGSARQEISALRVAPTTFFADRKNGEFACSCCADPARDNNFSRAMAHALRLAVKRGLKRSARCHATAQVPRMRREYFIKRITNQSVGTAAQMYPRARE
jgi:predicted DNA-binding ribbon-helix-helix protein